ncbi:MAG: hypothetical protein AB7U34_04135 [Novosphingobium sp.]
MLELAGRAHLLRSEAAAAAAGQDQPALVVIVLLVDLAAAAAGAVAGMAVQAVALMGVPVPAGPQVS